MSIRCLRVPAALLFPVIGVAGLHAQSGANTLTWHNNNSRTGTNTSESALTLTSVNAQKFGKTGFISTDGVVDAQPLYVAKLKINGASHNVVFIASEHNTVYAADAQTGDVLWKTSLTPSGETTSDDRGCSAISPEIGISSTPVIVLDQGPHGAIYVVSATKNASGGYRQRINALDLTTGAQLFGGPTEITASYPGIGENSSEGRVVFDPSQYVERAALLSWQNVIHTVWSSHCDQSPYTGWMIDYSLSGLSQTLVYNFTPNGKQGAVWMSNAGVAADNTRMYLLDANGTFDTTLDDNGFPASGDYGNCAVALAVGTKGLYVSDYYATDTTVQQSNADADFGSGGIVLFPATDHAGNNYQLAAAAGKDHNIYILDTTNMGHYHPNGGYVYQVLSGALPNGEFGAPAYFDHKIYYGGVDDYLKAFSLSNAKLLSTPVSQSANTYGYPGTTPVISANGTANGIVWAVANASPAVLYAYDAEDLSQRLYNSNQSGTRDQFGSVDHFISPLVANGRVYVPTQTGVAVFGLLGN